MFVKICGTTSLEDALLATEAGADALGFIFAPSKRRVTAEAVAAMTRDLRGDLLLVGVFTKPDVKEIAHTMHLARLAAVQMHWRYDPRIVDALEEELGGSVELWQVVGFPIDAENQTEAEAEFRTQLRAALLDSRVDVILLDAVKGGASGGLGVSFAWERAAAILQQVVPETAAMREQHGAEPPRFVLAGGLRAENVGEAIGVLRPWGVDVVSGVEAEAGRKDPEKLRRFVEAARGRAAGV